MELGNIERHIFAAHFVERPDYAALEDRPEAFDGLSVNCADDILPSRMINSYVRVVLVERIVARILIGAKQADFVRYGFADECGESGGIHIRDHARNHIALAANSADDWCFAGTNAACSAAAALIPMPVFCPCEVSSCADFGILHSHFRPRRSILRDKVLPAGVAPRAESSRQSAPSDPIIPQHKEAKSRCPRV